MATYSINPNSSSVNEGGSITWTIITTGVANGTQLFWENVGTTTGADFTSGSNSGSVVINNNFAILPITIAEDFTSEAGVETIIIRLYTNSLLGTLVATASTVNVADTSTEKTYTIFPSTTTVVEGSSITWNITTTNVATGTPLFWINTGNTSAVDFVEFTNSGVIYVNSSGTASLTLTLIGDLVLEGSETVIILLKSDSIVGPTVASSTPVIITDNFIGTSGNFNKEIETIAVNDKLIISSGITKTINIVVDRTVIESEIKRTENSKKEGTNQEIIFINAIKKIIVDGFRLDIRSEKIYDVDDLDNPRFSPNVINISSKYYINSIKNFSATAFKTYLDANNGVSLLKIDSTANGAFDVRDYYDNNRRWTALFDLQTNVSWGPLKVQIDSPNFRYLDLSGGTYEVIKIKNVNTQVYQQPTALQAKSIAGGLSPAVEIKKHNTRFYLWKPRTQGVSTVLANKSLFVATDNDVGTRGINPPPPAPPPNKGYLTSENVVHLDTTNNSNILEIIIGKTTKWPDPASSVYSTTAVSGKFNIVNYDSVIEERSNPPVIGFLSDWQTLIVTSESEGPDIEGTCWTQNLPAITATTSQPAVAAKSLLNGVGTKFLRDLKVGDKIINKDFVGFGFNQRFLPTNQPDNGAPGTGPAQVKVITKVLSDTSAEVEGRWNPVDSESTTVPMGPFKIFKNLTKQSRGITKYYVEGILVATLNLAYQSWLIDKIGAMNSKVKNTTTKHAAPGFLAQAGIMDKILNELEVYELHLRLKSLKDPNIDKASYLINPHLSEEKYAQSLAFNNSSDPLGNKNILTITRHIIGNEKLKTNTGPGEIENQRELFFINSSSGLKTSILLNVRSEKVTPFELSINEAWAY